VLNTPGDPAFIPRLLTPLLQRTLRQYPVLVLTGPRQAGKSTLLRQLLGNHGWLSLEDPDLREFAVSDPRGFLAHHPAPQVIDEAQRVPALLSYLQSHVDRSGAMGGWVLSGSHSFALLEGVTQTLAGRAAMLELLPLALPELAGAGRLDATLDATIFDGGYPAPRVRRVPMPRYMADYVSTYLERDVRRISAVHDLGSFQRFMRLAAARTAQLLNLSALAVDAGISQPTAAAWMNLLEAGYIVKRVPPFHRNFGKRLVKTPKLYFLDTALAAWLLDIRSPEGLATHHARGALFETLVVSEALKWRAARGDPRPVYFWRDNVGHEIDLLLEDDGIITLVEVKSGATFQGEWLRMLDTVQRHIGQPCRRAVVYGGDIDMSRGDVEVLGWRSLGALRSARA
jgi:predicted AAA+ superfamily ATPase